MRHYYYLFLLFIAANTANAQQADTLPGSWIVTGKVQWGFIIAHRPTIVHLQREHVHGFELNLTKPLTGDKTWQQPYLLPSYSLAFQFFYLGDKQELGNGYALVPRINFPLNSNHLISTSLNAGVGIGYVEKRYDRYENFKNVAIGSHINAVVNFSFNATINTSSKTQAETGITFTHFSNGTVHPPNLGINIPTLHAGFNWYIGKQLPRNFTKPVAFKKESFNKIILGTGIKGLETDRGINYYGIGCLSYSRHKAISKKCNLSLGTDAFYDKTLVKKLENLGKVSSDEYALRLGITFGFDLVAGNTTLFMQNGLYVYDRYKEDGIYYTKIGVEYKINMHLLAGFYLKSHYAKADFFEYAIGYAFK